ncbi:MAG TPA: glycosyl hydrolase family 28 protein [Polyangiaceae bacterium]|nr:glycosyl hydrolase family 28 protein [Polyangiaceae bacterium]
MARGLGTRVIAALLPTVTSACAPSSDSVPPLPYVCGFASPSPGGSSGADGAAEPCGAGDPNLPPEPTLPTTVCQTLTANKSTPDESNLDTTAIQTALTACEGQGAVKLTSDGSNNVFVSGHLTVRSTILWIDAGTTLYGSRNPAMYQSDGNCGLLGVSDADGCLPLLTVTGTSPGIVGDGIIDGQGGEPIVGENYSWWDMSGALRSVDGSAPNPSLIEIVNPTTGFLMYRITLHNSPKFHVKLSSTPAGGTCTAPGAGFVVWGVTILTPSRWTNSQNLVMSPYIARNTDGIDPGEGDDATCGVLACNTISTGDDDIALKGGHTVENLVIAHNHFGSGHGMSIGSETYTGVSNVNIYDLTIDADSRSFGAPASDYSDFNGIRVKSDLSRGGPVDDITYSDICVRDIVNAILINTEYNPLFAGTSYPNFGSLSFHNFHSVNCMALTQPVVTLGGFNALYPAGPITLDNVIVDGIGPQAVSAQFASFVLGPGDVNFMPAGVDVNVTDNISGQTSPYACTFPTLPTAEGMPPGWLW